MLETAGAVAVITGGGSGIGESLAKEAYCTRGKSAMSSGRSLAPRGSS